MRWQSYAQRIGRHYSDMVHFIVRLLTISGIAFVAAACISYIRIFEILIRKKICTSLWRCRFAGKDGAPGFCFTENGAIIVQ